MSVWKFLECQRYLFTYLNSKQVASLFEDRTLVELNQKTASLKDLLFIFVLWSEYCVPQSSSSSSAGGGGAGLYLDAYEVSFPLEENVERPPAYHLNQGQQMIDGTPHLLHMTTAVTIALCKSLTTLFANNAFKENHE